MIETLGNIALYGTPWLYVKAGIRFIDEHNIDSQRNRQHPWKVPPAELVLLAAAVIGWLAILALTAAYGHISGIQGTPVDLIQTNIAPPYTGAVA